MDWYDVITRQLFLLTKRRSWSKKRGSQWAHCPPAW
jgi:hypothetical protein